MSAARDPHFRPLPPRSAPTGRVFGVVLFVLVTLAVAIFGFFAAKELFDPVTDGHVGTAKIVECDDSHGTYQECFGDFNSDDHQVSFTNTRIYGEDQGQAGQSFTAYGDPGTKMVTVAASGQERGYDIGGLVFMLLAWLGVTYGFVYRPLRRRRSNRRSAPEGVSVHSSTVRHYAQPGRVARVLLLVGFIVLTLFVLLLAIGVIQEFRSQGGTSAAASGSDPWTLLGVILVLLLGDVVLFVYGIHQPRKHRQAAQLASDGATGPAGAGS